MVVRWVWTVKRGNATCTYYSKEFALDVDWQIYSADMHDSWNGVPAAVWPSSCPWIPWKNETGAITELRFEPNENITNSSFYQEIDWIRMTKVDQVIQGQPYTIKADLNIPTEQLSSIKYYYTNNLDDPTQYQAYSPPTNPLPNHAPLIYLPMIVSPSNEPLDSEADLVFKWDTSQVSPGAYYICALSDDIYNQSIFCSDAPVQVISP